MDYSSSADVDRSLHLPHAHPYQTPQSATGPSFAPQYHNMDSSAAAQRNLQSSHMMNHDPSNLHPNHVHHQQTYYNDPNAARQALATPSTPSQHASPQFSHMSSPAQSRQQYTSSPPSHRPHDRSLPSCDVREEGFDDAYAQFILYCNPSFPADTDTSELKKVFRGPPKSDGKSFSIFSLFELIKRFDNKELKTWTELALELGVERPSVEKGQSSQKIQQYGVRLKRWMKALHIDAFFDFLQGKRSELKYFRAIPPLNDPYPETRDGIAIEEDLAIRALDPKFRPKRGRRRADEQDEDMEPMSAIDPKRPHLDTSIAFQSREDYPMSAYPQSAVPMSAHPDFANGDPWSSLTTPASAMAPRSAMSTASQPLRWRNETPTTPHPFSANTPMSTHPDSWNDEPPSAVTPGSARSAGRRRRHGPAVSSAWPSTNTTASGKLRGRPPSNRSVRDGPFVTFPANPKTKEGPIIDLASNRRENSSEATPTPGATESPKPVHHFLTPQLPTPVSASTSHPLPTRPLSHPSMSQRPERLQLQVPQHVGGPVHLVTPTLLVNGQLNEQQPPQSATLQTPAVSTASTARTTTSSFFGPPGEGTTATEFDDDHHTFLTPKTSPHMARGSGNISSPLAPRFGTEDLKRALVADLLRAEIKGRTKRLRGTEAKDLADAILRKLNAQHTSGGQSTAAEDLHRFLCASWLGVIPNATPSSTGKKITVRRFRVGGDGYDSPLEEDDPLTDGDEVRETFDIEWTQTLGALSGTFAVNGVSLGLVENSEHGEDEDMSGNEDWRAKFLRSEEKRREQEAELANLKTRVLDAVL